MEGFRRFEPAVEVQDSLRVMSFNVLAQGLTIGFVKCSPEHLKLETRVKRIADEIIRYSPDIACLQEVDMYEQLMQALQEHGYSSEWQPKNLDSNNSRPVSQHGPDGSAIFYRTNKLVLASCVKSPIKEFSQVFVRCTFALKSKVDPFLLDVTCLHLKAKGGYEAMRAEQGQFILDEIKQSPADRNYLIVGDLNSRPTELVHDLIRENGFMSAYKKVLGSDPEFTTCKIRKDGEEVKTEDYIYLKSAAVGGLAAASVLSLPSKSDLGEERLPNSFYPSDHISIVADFTVTKSADKASANNHARTTSCILI